jgi:hypothetical protein
VATVDASGVAKGVGVGTATIKATLNGISGSGMLTVNATLQSIAVTAPGSSINQGATEPFTATGTYSDGTTRNLTSQVSWSSSPNSVATVNASGLATGVGVGTATIKAALGGVSGSSVLTVSAVLQSIAVAASGSSISDGSTDPFSATGTFSDGSTRDLTSQVSWTSANPAVASISPTGVATGVGPGTATITASLNGVSGSAPLAVTALPAPPHATGIAGVTHSRKGLTSITIGFDAPLDPGSAATAAHYSLSGAVKKRRSISYTRPVGFLTPTYNPGSNSVKLSLTSPFKGTVKVQVYSGILGASGAASQGDFTTYAG